VLWHHAFVIALANIAILLIADAGRFVLRSLRSRRSLTAENLFLRRQLALCKERGIRPRQIDLATRVSLAVLAKLNPAWAHEQRGQSEHHAIEHGQIRSAMVAAIADKQLMLQQQRLRSDGAHATWADEFHKGDQQVDGENEDVAHGQTVPQPPTPARLRAQANSLTLRFRHPQALNGHLKRAGRRLQQTSAGTHDYSLHLGSRYRTCPGTLAEGSRCA
jgi:hypothetical protein